MTKEKNEPFHGKITVHPRGFGFVSGSASGQDVFIPKPFISSALDGDTVEAIVTDESKKGLEGKVLAIIERARSEFVGTVTELLENGVAQVLIPVVSREKTTKIRVGKECKVGDRIILEVDEWKNNGEPEEFECKKIIGSIFDAKTDVEAASHEFHLRSDFPEEVLKAAEALGSEVSEKAMLGRLDYRDKVTLTIDPETAKDFDDALSISQDSKGHFHLGVHIADVAHYIPAGSPLDREAKRRCNSTYFPGVCVPMIPYALSNELCSLKPFVPRLTMSIFMEFDTEGMLVKHQVKRAVIQSKQRFTYEEAKEILDGKKEHTFSPDLKIMHSLARLLKKDRRRRGSVEFSTEELELIIDENGEPTGTQVVEHDIAHQLVEEFMIKANAVVAMHLTKKQKGMIYRIHAPPGEDDLGEFIRLATLLGHKLPKTPKPHEIQAVLEKEKGTPQGQQLAIHYIRSMKLAVYTPDNIGHFGLSLEHYGHFTSPIRRYPDLIVQRLLFDEHDKSISLIEVSDDCSRQERISAKAENSVIYLKKLRYLQRLSEKDKGRTYKALIKDVKTNGIVFEVEEIAMEGYIPIAELCNEYLTFEAKTSTLKSRSHAFALFASIEVMIEDLDLIYMKCRWKIAGEGLQKKRHAPGRTKSKPSSEKRGASSVKLPFKPPSKLISKTSHKSDKKTSSNFKKKKKF